MASVNARLAAEGAKVAAIIVFQQRGVLLLQCNLLFARGPSPCTPCAPFHEKPANSRAVRDCPLASAAWDSTRRTRLVGAASLNTHEALATLGVLK